jgi:glycosyltransferase involved in cell wall biosynthesis
MSKVSVCMPIYNPDPTYVQAAIESILQQDYPDFELLLVDDCSTRPADRLFEELADPRVKFHRNSRNYGLPGNWSRCVELAQGEYITIFHQDDLMYPHNLARKAEMLDRHPSMGLVYSDIWNIDETGQKLSRHPARISDADQVLTGLELLSITTKRINPIACPSVMARKSCYERLGAFDARLTYSSDLEMWLRIAKSYEVGFIGEPLVGRRLHAAQASHRYYSDGTDFIDLLNALDIAFADWPSPGYARYARAAYLTLSQRAGVQAASRLRHMRPAQAAQYTSIMFTAWKRARRFSSQ